MYVLYVCIHIYNIYVLHIYICTYLYTYIHLSISIYIYIHMLYSSVEPWASRALDVLPGPELPKSGLGLHLGLAEAGKQLLSEPRASHPQGGR